MTKGQTGRRGVIAAAVLCCAAMAVVDGVIQPGYAAKSAIKLALFLAVPFLLSRLDRELLCAALFRLKGSRFAPALALGAGVYVLILGGYVALSGVFDFSGIASALALSTGVTRENFLLVSLYISFINSLLEEFFFRGFVFLNLRRRAGRTFAYLFSAVLFAVYHAAMLIGWFSPVLFALVMLGLTAGGVLFNWLNERRGTIYVSWLVHMFANFAINTVGFILL